MVMLREEDVWQEHVIARNTSVAQAQALVRVRLLSSTTTTTSGIDCNLSSSFLGCPFEHQLQQLH